MASPIHKFLFSPPPSPPRRAADAPDPVTHGLTSLSSLLLPTDLVPRLDTGDLKVPSPRTPQQSHFTLADTYPGYPSVPVRRTPNVTIRVNDVEETPKSIRRPPLPRITEKVAMDPEYQPANVPSLPMPSNASLPRPLVRLLFLASLVLSSVMLLVFFPQVRLPSLRAASVGRRLAMAPDGRAYLDIENTVSSWAEALDRDYQPPQIRAPHMMKRSETVFAERSATPPPRASRPAQVARPLPVSHELLALQSYLLGSAYNVLPMTLDASSPLDANTVLGVGAHRLGPVGSTRESAWFADLEAEYGDDIIVWYGGDGALVPPHHVLDLLGLIHGRLRRPSLIPCHQRTDLHAIHGVFDRLGLDLKSGPIIMIGNEPSTASQISEMSGSGKLREVLASIGWASGEPIKKAQNWKPKLAVLRKRELTEVERALETEKAE